MDTPKLSATIVPIDSWTRQQLNVLETFVMNNVKIPDDVLSMWKPGGKATIPYKPFWNGSTMTINMSKWCKLTINFQERGELVDSISLLKRGLYQFELEFPHIYFGNHKDNYLYSIACRIVKVNYQCPDISSNKSSPDPIDELFEEISCAEPPKKKRKRASKAKNEEKL